MKVCITGGTGFIGSYIVRELLAHGHSLHLLVRNPDKIPYYHTVSQIALFEGTLQNEAALTSAMTGCDAYIHIASPNGADFSESIEKDVLPTVRAFEIAASLGVKTVLYTSTTCVAGDAPARGEYDALRPGGGGGPAVYGCDKSACEHYLLAMAAAGKFTAHVVRPGFTFGNPAFPGSPTENPLHIDFIAKWLEIARRGGEIHVGKDYVCQFLHAGYTARIYRALLTCQQNRRVVYALDENTLSMEQIAHMVIDTVGRGSVVVDEAYVLQPADRIVGFCPKDTWVLFDTSNLKKEFHLCFDSEQMLRDHVQYAAKVMFPEK